MAKMDIVGFEIDVDEIRMPPPPPPPPPHLVSRVFTLEKQNTHQHTDQVNEDENKGSSKGKRFQLCCSVLHETLLLVLCVEMRGPEF